MSEWSEGIGGAVLGVHRGNGNRGSGTGDGRIVRGEWKSGNAVVHDSECTFGGVYGGKRIGWIARGGGCGEVHADESDRIVAVGHGDCAAGRVEAVCAGNNTRIE